LDEHDAAIGKGGKSYLPAKHEGFIVYGLDENCKDDDLLAKWK